MRPSRTAMEQAAQLALLLDAITGERRLWTAEERRRAKVLVALLSEHALAAERGKAA